MGFQVKVALSIDIELGYKNVGFIAGLEKIDGKLKSISRAFKPEIINKFELGGLNGKGKCPIQIDMIPKAGIGLSLVMCHAHVFVFSMVFF